MLTNCHNSLCAVGGTINEDDHRFGLSAAKKYGIGNFSRPDARAVWMIPTKVMSWLAMEMCIRDRYGKQSQRPVFSKEALWKTPGNVLEEYPVVLSTTYTARSSLGKLRTGSRRAVSAASIGGRHCRHPAVRRFVQQA